MTAPWPHTSLSVRERIVEAATRLFAAQGYSATSVRQLVEASACTRPSLYYYFDSKEMLFEQLVAFHLQSMERLIEDFQQTEGSLRQRTHDAVERVIDYARAHPHAMRLLHRIETGAEPGIPQVNLQGAHQLHMELLTEIMEQGIASGELRQGSRADDCAHLLVGVVDDQIRAALETHHWDRDRLHRMIDLVFDGIVA